VKKNYGHVLLVSALLLWVVSASLFSVQEKERKDITMPTLKELWARVQETLPPFSYKILKDEMVPSDTDPRQTLRRMEVRFTSQIVGQWMRRMEHTAVIFLPSDPRVYSTPDKKGKVVVVAKGYSDKLMIPNYGEPIAARTGYPTMVIPIPGEYNGHDGESCWMQFFRLRILNTKDPVDHGYFRLAIPYIRALDVFEDLLGTEKIRAVIGGHSKRAPAAFNAAAIDPDRVAGVIYMGMESTFFGYENRIQKPISPLYSQREVKCPVFYIGATNEDGYAMFNINKVQLRMQTPWTIEMVPNYRHATNSEVQIMDWMMWIGHIFEGRPLTRISDLSHEENSEGTIFRARIDSPNKIIQTKVWYVYCDDVPYWRDLMWYPTYLNKKGDIYEAFVMGKLPDAWIVEVKDIAGGHAGYVSSLPQDITHKPVKERTSYGWHSRNWEMIKKK